MAIVAADFDPIQSISPAKERWNLNVRVVRMYSVPDQYSDSKVPFSVEMVLQDKHGHRIQASIRKMLIYMFQKILKEGETYEMLLFDVAPNTASPKIADHKYRLNFEFSTEVKHQKDSNIASVTASFKSISVLSELDLNHDVLVDVMAILTGVGNEREVGKKMQKSKMIILQLSVMGMRVECALFGPYVDEVHSFVSSGDVCNTVIGVQFAKVKSFQGKVGIQNVYHATKLWFNLDTPEANELRKSYLDCDGAVSQTLNTLPDAHTSVVDKDFFKTAPEKSIGEVKHFSKDCTFVVLAHIRGIQQGSPWWYMSCNNCNKSVYADSSMYYCDTCVRHVVTVTPRYRIKVYVEDDTESAVFVIFDHQACEILSKTCCDMIEEHQKVASLSEVPLHIQNLVGKLLLFKTDFKLPVNPKFEPSYCVRRLSCDPFVFQRFREWSITKPSLLALPSGSDEKSVSIGTSSNEISPKNLDVEFDDWEGEKTCAVTDSSVKRSSEEVVDLSVDDVQCSKINNCVQNAAGFQSSSDFGRDLTPIKISHDEFEKAFPPDRSSVIVNKKKKIKVEKD